MVEFRHRPTLCNPSVTSTACSVLSVVRSTCCNRRFQRQCNHTVFVLCLRHERKQMKGRADWRYTPNLQPRRVTMKNPRRCFSNGNRICNNLAQRHRRSMRREGQASPPETVVPQLMGGDRWSLSTPIPVAETESAVCGPSQSFLVIPCACRRIHESPVVVFIPVRLPCASRPPLPPAGRNVWRFRARLDR